MSTGGGFDPRWRGDSKELFYVAPDRKLMAVDLKTAGGFEAAVPRTLFQTRMFLQIMPGPRYDVTADGQRFLMNTQADEAFGESATVVLNWTAALKK